MPSLPRGIYTPLPCFFKENEDIDFDSFQSHVKYTARSGTVPVISGTAGEAVHLDRTERVDLIKAAREALQEIGLPEMPVVAGVGAPSTRESIILAKEASGAGADFVMAIPPGYYAGALISNSDAVKSFFVDIAQSSPVPVIVYNFPGVSGGIDMSSDLIVDIVKATPNVYGVKLTCANVGKLTRIMAETSTPEFKKQYPRKEPEAEFRAIDGFIDFLMPSISSGSAGAISGLPNFAPKACVKLWDLCQGLNDQKTYSEAQKLQNLVSLADGMALKVGISGMKKLLNRRFGYGVKPRRPLTVMSNEAAEPMFSHRYLNDLLALEESLPELPKEDLNGRIEAFKRGA